MVKIREGSSWIGCDVFSDPGCSKFEKPGRNVQLKAFKINKFEVTQSEFNSCVKAKRCTAPNKNFDPIKLAKYPVTNVSWFQASSYCAWRKGRLPTEAEWEKAARGEDRRIYSWGNIPPTCAKANSSVKCGYQTTPVGSSKEDLSPYGAIDMVGNVEEWTGDWFRGDYYSESMVTDPRGPLSGDERSVRGGAFNSDAWHSRVTHRFYAFPNLADDFRGFRCAMNMPSEHCHSTMGWSGFPPMIPR